MEPVGPIATAHLFTPLHRELMTLLAGLSPSDWQLKTVCSDWRVRDIVAHLLDGDIRRLSLVREGIELPSRDSPIAGYHDLVAFLNELNADWIRATSRMSPRLLIDFLAITGPQVSEFLTGLDPNDMAKFPVAWAGEQESLNWFDIAREYTEKWHHQQQIRDAVGAPGLVSRYWLFPVLDTFMRVLPYTYRNTNARVGTAIAIRVTGEAGGDWALIRSSERWLLYSGSGAGAACTIVLDQDAAWRLFTKQPNQAVRIEGATELGNVFFGSLAVMA